MPGRRSTPVVDNCDRKVPFFSFLFTYPLSMELSALSAAEPLVSDRLPDGALGAVVIDGRRNGAVRRELAR
jgi:hypothetical protein